MSQDLNYDLVCNWSKIELVTFLTTLGSLWNEFMFVNDSKQACTGHVSQSLSEAQCHGSDRGQVVSGCQTPLLIFPRILVHTGPAPSVHVCVPLVLLTVGQSTRARAPLRATEPEFAKVVEVEGDPSACV